MLFLWLLGIAVTGQDITCRGVGCPVALLPSWCPKKWLQFMLRPFPFLALYPATWISLMLVGFCPQHQALRILAATALTLYVFAESSVTHGHRDHANVYTAWAVALLPAGYAEGVSLGVCVFMMGSSGFCKVMVGGTKHWAAPDTLRAVLNEYKDLPFGVGPGSKALCEYCVARDWILLLLNVGTLLFECGLAPAALIMPPGWRFVMIVGSVALHLGICVLQSFGIGLAFLPGLATYFVGYAAGEGDHVEVLSQEWVCSIVIFALPTLYMLFTQKVLPEDFPLTPYALFTWNSKQWTSIHGLFVNNDTRLVLATDDVAIVDMPGCTVLNKWGMPSVGEGVEGISASRARPEHDRTRVFDAWDQIIGQTLVFNPVVRALDFDAMSADWDASVACRRIEDWLREERPFFEVSSGMALVRCYFVRLDAQRGSVTQVLSCGLKPALLEGADGAAGPGQRGKAMSEELPRVTPKAELGRSRAASAGPLGVFKGTENERARVFSYP